MATGITGGILPDGPIVFDEAWQREREEMAAREAAAAEYAVEVRRRCAEIDLMAGRYMRPQLERQRVVTTKVDMARFRKLLEFCRENDWPPTLPIRPHALFELIVSESEKGYKHILAITKSIAKISEAAGEDACPTRDPLVRAYLDLVHEEETAKSTTTTKGTDDNGKV